MEPVSDSGTVSYYRRVRLWREPYRAIVNDTVWTEVGREDRAVQLLELNDYQLRQVADGFFAGPSIEEQELARRILDERAEAHYRAQQYPEATKGETVDVVV